MSASQGWRQTGQATQMLWGRVWCVNARPPASCRLTIHVVVLVHGGCKHGVQLDLGNGGGGDKVQCMAVSSAASYTQSQALCDSLRRKCQTKTRYSCAACGPIHAAAARTAGHHIKITPTPHLCAAQAELLVLHSGGLARHAGDLGAAACHLDPHAARRDSERDGGVGGSGRGTALQCLPRGASRAACMRVAHCHSQGNG